MASLHSASTPAAPPRPGIMVVYPELKHPNALGLSTAETSSAFRKWTKLHFRDLLDVQPRSLLGGGGAWGSSEKGLSESESRPAGETTSIPRVVRQGRFVHVDVNVNDNEEKEADANDNNTESPPRYLYTTHMQDIRIIQSKEYLELSRALNLETTRALQEGEEAVGAPTLSEGLSKAEHGVEGAGEGPITEANVSHICAPLFAVYEQMEWDLDRDASSISSSSPNNTDNDNDNSCEFQSFPPLGTIPVPIVSDADAGTHAHPKHTPYGISIRIPATAISSQHTLTVRELKTKLRDAWKADVFVSVYRRVSDGEQPPGHPLARGGEGDWCVLGMVVVEGGNTGTGRVVKAVGEKAVADVGIECVGEGKGVDVDVWRGELLWG